MTPERWEAGSSFPLAALGGTARAEWLPKDAVLHGTGRQAIRALLQHGCDVHGWRRIRIGSYSCPGVVRALRGVLPIVYYPCTPGIETAPLPRPRRSRGRGDRAHQRHHAGAPVRPPRRHDTPRSGGQPARPGDLRERRPGPRRHLARPAGRHLRRVRDVQPVPDQEHDLRRRRHGVLYAPPAKYCPSPSTPPYPPTTSKPSQTPSTPSSGRVGGLEPPPDVDGAAVEPVTRIELVTCRLQDGCSAN